MISTEWRLIPFAYIFPHANPVCSTRRPGWSIHVTNSAGYYSTALVYLFLSRSNYDLYNTPYSVLAAMPCEKAHVVVSRAALQHLVTSSSF